MKRHHRTAATLLVATLFTSVAPASARTPAEANAEARDHFQRGVTLYDEQDYRAALIEFERAYAVAPSKSVLFNIGQSHYQLLDYADALTTLERYLAQTGADVPEARRVLVEREIAELRDRVAHLTLRANVDGADVTIDDLPAGRTPLATPLLVAAGRRKIVLTRGRQSSMQYVDLAGGDARVVTFELNEPAPPAEAAASTPNDALAAPEPRHAPAMTYVGLGLSIVGLAAGSLFGILALDAKRSLDRHCVDKACGPESQSDIDTLDRDATIATIGFATALGGAGIAVVALVTGGSSEAPRSSARVTPVVGPRFAGVSGSF